MWGGETGCDRTLILQHSTEAAVSPSRSNHPLLILPPARNYVKKKKKPGNQL